jgi:Protein of unknown function (DUF3618)
MRQSEQLEREAEEARFHLAESLNELRFRVSPGQVVDQIAEYAREGPVADFLGNLTREMRDNPVPLLLIGIAITWLVAATSLSHKRTIIERETPAAVPPVSKTSPIKVAPVVRTQSQRSRILTPADA